MAYNAESLDRYITGNWGEDSVPNDEEIVDDSKCPECGYPLVLKENDDPNDPVFEESMYEQRGGLCGNCQMHDFNGF